MTHCGIFRQKGRATRRARHGQHVATRSSEAEGRKIGGKKIWWMETLEFAAFALLETSYPKFSYLQNDVGSGEWLGGAKLLVCWRPSNLTRAHSRSDNAEF